MTEQQQKMKLNQTICAQVKGFNTYFDGCQDNFRFGNCYWYAHILQERFRRWYPTEIMYNPIDNHFACRIGDLFFDILGQFDPNLREWETWEHYKKVEPLGAARVYRDCAMHMEGEEWLAQPIEYRQTPWL